ncbi:MAG: hypothetical protein ACT4QD_09545 [Acidobacteriota bacterium]
MVILLLLALSMVLATPAVAQEENPWPRGPRASYLILGVGKTPIRMFLGRNPGLQRQLDEAADRGYRVVGGFENGLILHAAPDRERYSYTTAWTSEAPVRATDMASMEHQMDAAAERGFRLVRHALGYPLIAVMERRAATPSTTAGYRVLSVTTEYVMSGDRGRGTIISGRFDTDAIDERLAEMSVAGFRLITVVRRNLGAGTERTPAPGLIARTFGQGLVVEEHRLRQELIFLFEREADKRAGGTTRGSAHRYHLVTALDEGELEDRLNSAAAAGYPLLLAVPHALPETIAIVERQVPSSQRPVYGVLATRRSRLTDELARADAAGWAPHARGLLETEGAPVEVLVVVERKQQSAPRGFVALAAIRSSTLARDLNEAAAAGFALLSAGTGWGERLLVLQR